MLAFPCIAPHGGVIIESLGNPKAVRAKGTRKAMAELRARAEAVGVDVWIVLGPHGVRAHGMMAISDAPRAVAHLEPEGPEGRPLHFEAPIHREMARALAQRCQEDGLPCARLADGRDTYPMDWSGAIPLWLLGAGGTAEAAKPVVQVVPSTELGWDGMVWFGEILGRFCDERPERVGVIASSDLAHAHDPAGPYGFHPAAQLYDEAVRQAIVDDEPMRLLTFDAEMVRAAKVDGQWPILALAGALRHRPIALEHLCYEVPTYFGMLTAGPRIA